MRAELSTVLFGMSWCSTESTHRISTSSTKSASDCHGKSHADKMNCSLAAGYGRCEVATPSLESCSRWNLLWKALCEMLLSACDLVMSFSTLWPAAMSLQRGIYDSHSAGRDQELERELMVQNLIYTPNCEVREVASLQPAFGTSLPLLDSMAFLVMSAHQWRRSKCHSSMQEQRLEKEIPSQEHPY